MTPTPPPGMTAKQWGSPLEREVRRRITLSVAAYAYEIMDTPILSDFAFDMIAQHIQPRMGTCRPIMDEFFAYSFSPMTGMWIHDHPELAGIKRLYETYYTGAVKAYCEKGVRFDRRPKT